MDRFDKRSANFVTFIENDSQNNAKRPSTGHILTESRNTDFNVIHSYGDKMVKNYTLPPTKIVTESDALPAIRRRVHSLCLEYANKIFIFIRLKLKETEDNVVYTR